MMAHIKDGLCAGEKERNEFLLNCLAYVMQSPWNKGGVAHVFKGQQGAGKNIILNVLRSYFGPSHSTEVTNVEHATGRFNSHMAQSVIAVFNEAVWGGNKQAEATLKAQITDLVLPMERKFKELTMLDSFCNIFIIANLDNWAASVAVDNRRFVYYPVSGHWVADKSHFDKLAWAIRQGEDRELLWYLLRRRLPTDNWMPGYNRPTRCRLEIEDMLTDNGNAPLRILLEGMQLCLNATAWTYRIRAHNISIPVIRSGEPTVLHRERFREIFGTDSARWSPGKLTQYMKQLLGPCFSNDARRRQGDFECKDPEHDQDNEVSRKSYFKLDSCENIQAYLASTKRVPMEFWESPKVQDDEPPQSPPRVVIPGVSRSPNLAQPELLHRAVSNTVEALQDDDNERQVGAKSQRSPQVSDSHRTKNARSGE